MQQARMRLYIIGWQDNGSATSINNQPDQATIKLLGGTGPFTGSKPNVNARRGEQGEQCLLIEVQGNNFDGASHDVMVHLASVTIFYADADRQFTWLQVPNRTDA